MPNRICNAPGCNRKYRSSGYCKSHASRLYKTGNIRADIPIKPLGRVREFYNTLIEQSQNTEECIAWPFNRHPSGYGKICIDGKQTSVCRQLLFDAVGPPPQIGMHAAHSCGNANCVNLKHLRWATCRDNLMDKHKHGTAAPKLTAEKVLQIRSLAATMPATDIAKLFGISEPHTYAIIRKAKWSHI